MVADPRLHPQTARSFTAPNQEPGLKRLATTDIGRRRARAKPHADGPRRSPPQRSAGGCAAYGGADVTVQLLQRNPGRSRHDARPPGCSDTDFRSRPGAENPGPFAASHDDPRFQGPCRSYPARRDRRPSIAGVKAFIASGRFQPDDRDGRVSGRFDQDKARTRFMTSFIKSEEQSAVFAPSREK